MKRKYYLFCTINGIGQYYYNIDDQKIRIYVPETDTTNIKMNKKISVYPITILVLIVAKEKFNIPIKIPFITTFIVALLMTLFIYFWLFPYQDKKCAAMKIVNFSTEELQNLALIGKRELKKLPWIAFVGFPLILFIYIIFSYKTNGNPSMRFFQEIFLGILSPLFFILPGVFERTKIYNNVLKG